jgi:putative oxidoreductase
MFDDMIDRVTARLEPVFLLVARLLFAALFLPSGIRKISGVGEFAQSLASRGVPAPTALAWIGAIAEFIGPILIAIGLKTRAAALLMVVFTLIATAIAHRFWEFQEAARVAQQSNFLKNLAIVGGLLILAARGAGPYSLDAMLGRRDRP